MSTSRRLDRHAAGGDLSLHDAVAALTKAGARVFCVLPGTDDAVSLAEAARRLDVGTDWVRARLAEFPNRFRLPAGERKTSTGEGKNVGEWRIPVADIAAFKERYKAKGPTP